MSQYRDVSMTTSELVISDRLMGRAGIVLHSTEGSNSIGWLQGASAIHGEPASADFLVDRAGNIFQITPLLHFAYHVGVGSWRNLNNLLGRLNQMLVGIEMESQWRDGPRYTDLQLISTAALVRRLWEYHRLDVLSLLRHGDIALPFGRRSDPVAFPASTFTHELLHPSPLDPALVFPAALP